MCFIQFRIRCNITRITTFIKWRKEKLKKLQKKETENNQKSRSRVKIEIKIYKEKKILRNLTDRYRQRLRDKGEGRQIELKQMTIEREKDGKQIYK